MSEQNKSTFVRVSELAQELGITEDTLRRWVKDGKFPSPLRVGLRHYVWLRANVDVYFDDKQVEADLAKEDTNL